MGLGDTTRRVVVEFTAQDNNLATTVAGLDGRLRDVKGRLVSAGAAADAFGRTAQLSSAQAVTGYKRVQQQATAARDSVVSLAKSGKNALASIKDVGLLGLGFSTLASAVTSAALAVDEWSMESLEAQQVAMNMAFSIDAAAESTLGFVDNMTLAKNANRAFTTGVATSASEFADLAGATTAIASTTGESATKLLEQATIGIARKSAARLDDLGIILDQAKAEKVWARELGKTRKALTVLEKEEAFQKVALLEIKKAGDRAARSMDGFAVKVAKTKVELKNAKQELQGFSDDTGRVREALRSVTDEQLERLRFGEVADDASAAGREMNAFLGEWEIGLRDVRGQADKLGVSYLALIEGATEARDVTAVDRIIKNNELLNAEQAKGLREEAEATKRLSELQDAGGASQAEVNLLLADSLRLRRDAAELEGDIAKATEATHQIQLLAASAGRRGGGRGASRAERVRALGAAQLQDLEHMADLQSEIAETAEQVFAAEEASRAARLAGLELERQALEVTRARGVVAKAELATARAAVDQEAGLIVLQGRVAAREREAAAVEQLHDLEVARNASRAQEGAQVIELEAFRLEARAAELEAQGQLAAAFGVRLGLRAREAEMAAAEFAAREAEILAHPPETELERIQQLGELRELAHEQELARIQADTEARSANDAERERLAKAEIERKKRVLGQATSIAGATATLANQGMALGSLVLDKAGVDGEKRAKIEGKIAATTAIFTGVLETVKAAAAFASFNILEGAAHTGAAIFAFASATQLASGKPVASSGPGPVAAPTAAQAQDTGPTPTIPGSTPAVDREPGLAPEAEAGGGARVINIGEINALGAIDQGFVENLATELDNVQFSRGA